MKTGLIPRFRAAARQVLRAPVGWFLRVRERSVVSRLKHELAICAIFREEAPFLDEWLSFHQAVGATHFFLYNNGSTDHFRQVLQPWCERGVVTLMDWPGTAQQLSVYAHCIRAARGTCQWVAFIDVDEFLFSPTTVDIRSILRQYRDLPGLAVWEAFFGSNGRIEPPCAPVTLTYSRRASLAELRTVKVIANPRLVYKVGVHEFKFWGASARDTARRLVLPGADAVVDTLRINHYWSRSLEDLQTKVARGDASTEALRSLEWHYDFERNLNGILDETILPIASQILASHR